jgi:hypothetical protein
MGYGLFSLEHPYTVWHIVLGAQSPIAYVVQAMPEEKPIFAPTFLHACGETGKVRGQQSMIC